MIGQPIEYLILFLIISRHLIFLMYFSVLIKLCILNGLCRIFNLKFRIRGSDLILIIICIIDNVFLLILILPIILLIHIIGLHVLRTVVLVLRIVLLELMVRFEMALTHVLFGILLISSFLCFFQNY